MAVGSSRLQPYSHEQFDETLNVLNVSTTSVIPESTAGPPAAEKLEKTTAYWILNLDFVSSGMMFGAFSRLFHKCRGMENAWALSTFRVSLEGKCNEFAANC